MYTFILLTKYDNTCRFKYEFEINPVYKSNTKLFRCSMKYINLETITLGFLPSKNKQYKSEKNKIYQ